MELFLFVWYNIFMSKKDYLNIFISVSLGIVSYLLLYFFFFQKNGFPFSYIILILFASIGYAVGYEIYRNKAKGLNFFSFDKVDFKASIAAFILAIIAGFIVYLSFPVFKSFSNCSGQMFCGIEMGLIWLFCIFAVPILVAYFGHKFLLKFFDKK